MCIGCSLCTKKDVGCPFGAVMIVNIPSEIKGDIVNRYGTNGFRLYRMPIMKPGKILGLIGQNGIGKSTVVKILANKMKPNFEIFEDIDEKKIINKFKGNEMHKYMTLLYNNKLKVHIKIQHVDNLILKLKSKQSKIKVKEFIDTKSDYNDSSIWYTHVINTLELTNILESDVVTLSGGELQRLLCCVSFLKNVDVYIFDEPTNYLDVRQRLNVAKLIRELVSESQERYVVVVEHDLTILDYISDYISILYGEQSAYGVVSKPLNTSHGINIYFDGYIPSENIRFRKSEYSMCNIECQQNNEQKENNICEYNGTKIKYDKFLLNIESSNYPMNGSITVVMGKNGTGKTTFINYIAKEIKKSIMIKPQYLSVEQFILQDGKYPTVGEFLSNNIKKSYMNETFNSEVTRPMMINKIEDRKLNELSGGEMQRFWLVYCFGTESDIYLLDEPSACLDIEQRVITTKVIKRFIMNNKKTAFIIEHDMMMAVSLGSESNSRSVILEEQEEIENKRQCIARKSEQFISGMNLFLKIMDITFHTQKVGKTNRPRINKKGSMKDKEQKSNKIYYD
jgi:ATP-binding cassette, sub-family E, member 1